MKIHKMLQTHNSGSRNGETPKYIVIHYVGAISSARNNCLYFKNNKVPASAHFFCDSEIWQSTPISRSAWHCGGSYQDYGTKEVGGNKGAQWHGICRNQNSIGIELCCIKKNGEIVPSQQAIKTAVPLVKWLMKKYDIPASRVIRHFDVTGKCCPNGYISAAKWSSLHKTLTGKAVQKKKNPVYPAVTLQIGDKGEQVKRLQRCLNKIINAGLDVDGSFGTATHKAVKRFQKKYGLSVDGSVGPKTRAKIKELIK